MNFHKGERTLIGDPLLPGKPLLKRMYFTEWRSGMGMARQPLKQRWIIIRVFYKLTEKPVNFLRKGFNFLKCRCFFILKVHETVGENWFLARTTPLPVNGKKKTEIIIIGTRSNVNAKKNKREIIKFVKCECKWPPAYALFTSSITLTANLYMDPILSHWA
jgi:hypothetical protein